jgi:uncharacterized protein (TIGR02145 family)/uncharacterized repeat protein (TIGR02543 family)
VVVWSAGSWAGDYTLEVSVNPADGGTVSIDPKMDSYIDWVDVKVTANPNPGYAFEGWSGESTAKSYNITIEMSGNKNKKLTANFKMASGTFQDSRDGKTYKKITIGNHTWMAENLNYAGIKSTCYENTEENCAKYGRLYSWEMAKKACPAGFYLPSSKEWEALKKYAGSSKELKTTSGWEGTSNGTDNYGFSALPSGWSSRGNFSGVGEYGEWWSASESNGYIISYKISESDNVSGSGAGTWEPYLQSVRCVEDMVKKGSFTDKRDGKVYKTVKMDKGKTWFAENLNYAAKGSVCHSNEEDNCEKYGRLYDWPTAQKACPAGTHLPSDAEWTALTNYVGGDSIAGEKLKSTIGWNGSEGTDNYGFSALPGGNGYGSGRFINKGHWGYWWSATGSSDGNAWHRVTGTGRHVTRKDDINKSGKPYIFSIRCVVD